VETVVTEQNDSRVLVGVIGKPRGNRGEVYVEPFTDFPDVRFRAPGELFLERPGNNGDPARPAELVQSRWIGDRLVIRFNGVDSISGAEGLRGARVFADGEEEMELTEGSFYHHQLVGLAVVSEQGETLGKISGLLRTAAGDILEVLPPSGSAGEAFLIPAVEEFCYDIDLSEGIVRVRLPEGLLEINR
jgi:16S rRNA processing protein RimM